MQKEVSVNDIVIKLDQLSELQAATEVTRQHYEAKRTEILRAVQAELDALVTEFDPLIKSAEERAAALEAEIKKDVAVYGSSVKGRGLHAVYYHGRVSWDTKALDVYAVSHPEVIDFRRQGEPSVSIRVTK
jgi:hypothetical protein